MTAKEYLNQARMIEIKIKQLEAEITMLEESTSDIGSALSSDVKVKKSSSPDAAYTYKVEQIELLEKELSEQKYTLAIKRDEIVKTIHTLDNPVYVDILFRRYIEYKSLKQIAKEMHYEYGYVRKMHGKALKTIIF